MPEANAGNAGQPSRRAVLAAAGGIAATGLAAGLPPARAQGAPPAAEIARTEHWATKERDGAKISLAMHRKRIPSATPQPVLFLVHGSSAASLASFDLDVPGQPYSLMDAFARYGFDVWTMDHEGYGQSTRTEGNSDIASGVEDLKAASEVVARETGLARFSFLGESSGALRAAAFAAAQPERVDRIVLEAFTYTGEGSPTLGKRAEQLEFYRTHNRRPRDAAMLRSIFTRDKEGTTDPAVAEAFVKAEMPNGTSVPSGTYLDMTAHLPVVDPAKLRCPVLLIKGEFDGISSSDDLWAFFKQLPTGDKQFVVIPGAAHSIVLGTQRQALWHVVRAFLTMPPRQEA